MLLAEAVLDSLVALLVVSIGLDPCGEDLRSIAEPGRDGVDELVEAIAKPSPMLLATIARAMAIQARFPNTRPTFIYTPPRDDSSHISLPVPIKRRQ